MYYSILSSLRSFYIYLCKTVKDNWFIETWLQEVFIQVSINKLGLTVLHK